MKNKDDEKEVLQSLRKAYNLAISADEEPSFYVNTLNYLSIIDNSPFLRESVVKKFDEEIKASEVVLTKHEEKVTKSCTKIFSDIEQLINNKKIKLTQSDERLNDFKKHRDDLIASSNGKASNLVLNLRLVLNELWNISDGKYRRFLLKYGQKQENDLPYWDFLKLKDNLDQEVVRQKRLGLTTGGYYWKKLAYLYDLYTEYEQMRKNWFKKESIWGIYGVVEAHKDLLIHLGLEKDSRNGSLVRFFETEELKMSLVQVNFHLEEELQHPVEEKLIVDYNHKTMKLALGEKVVGFRTGNQTSLLEKIFHDKKRVPFDLMVDYMWGEKVEEFGEKEADRKRILKLRKKLSSYCSAINTRINKNMEHDLLIYDPNYIELSPTYSFRKS